MNGNRVFGLVSCILVLVGLNACSETQPASSAETKDLVSPTIELTGRVVDEANLLDEEAETALQLKLSKLEIESGPQFVIATTNSLNDQSIEEYSLKLARSWAVGHSGRDDGVVLLVAPNERKVRIEVGYGLEASLSDQFCAKVIKENILPAFRSGDLQGGILAGADRLITKMKATPTIELNDNQPLVLSGERSTS